ncbi:MAG: PadR family transcriptional regulator [Erysipelotrichaceae bacterium]|nr:PadR family transcriptional regulator [Erysipelotrichaceae bacterium]
MVVDKGYMSGSSQMLILNLLNEKSCYGYELIKMLKQRSNNVFELKEGTLYPILHKLENDSLIRSFNQEVSGRTRKYYAITDKGKKVLVKEKEEWLQFSGAVNQVLAFQKA